MTDNDRKAIRAYLAHWAAAQCIRLGVSTFAAGLALWQERGLGVAAIAFGLFWLWFGYAVPRHTPELDKIRQELGD